ADLLTLHFKAVDGNGNAVTSTPVHYTTAVTDAGIVKDTPACTTNGSGECTSTVKTTRAGTYNVWVALVPAGAAQPVSPVKTALVFLAGPPDATNTTVSTDKSAAKADTKETITVTLNPRDSHNNVVPLWTFRKDLTIVPSVNATVPGAVTVTTPAQDAAGNVAATLTYVDTSSKRQSKEARAGTTTIAISKAVTQTVDTRFYPVMHLCLARAGSIGHIVPGTTEVRLCDDSNIEASDGSGFTVTRPGLSSAGCTKGGGGVCPPVQAGKRADFTGLTGDDIAQLVFHPAGFIITDDLAGVKYTTGGPGGRLVYYGELAHHFPYAPLGGTYGRDLFHIDAATKYCRRSPLYEVMQADIASEALSGGVAAGGQTTDAGDLKTLYIGEPGAVIKTGGDTNPELFVPGSGRYNSVQTTHNDVKPDTEVDTSGHTGVYLPVALLMVNGARSASTWWAAFEGGTGGLDHDRQTYTGAATSTSMGRSVPDGTNWNVSDMYYVNNWPGTPLTLHRPDKSDTTNRYVTQVNYVSGYVCEASLQ
ncbi:Ig-like domain-containing protein, partial [Salmonella enterica]|nr:Ig-like domain-containing protein [Salmonella enterica]